MLPEGMRQVIADSGKTIERRGRSCELCGREGHYGDFHDTEIVEWLNADPASGETNGRAYAAYRRRVAGQKYPGFRKDVWAMMHVAPHLW